MLKVGSDRTPGFKLFLAIVVGFVLTIPLVSVYLLAYDRESQSREASRSITAGWGGPQTMTGPVLVIPYKATTTETVLQNGPFQGLLVRSYIRDYLPPSHHI